MAKKTKETELNFEGLIDPAAAAQPKKNNSSIPEDALINETQAEELGKEQLAEKEFGDADTRTFLESTASAVSFGLSDAALVQGAKLVGGEKAAEEMRRSLIERRTRNPEADIAGTVTGVVGPALLTGGTSLAAKGVASGASAAAKAGAAAERLSGKALASVLKDTGKKTLARKVVEKSIPKTAGSAVESGFYSVGELVSEAALGKEDFNAENLLAYYGTGAMLGGAAQGVLGTVGLLTPKIKGGKIVDFTKDKFSNILDKRKAAAKELGFSVNDQVRLESTKWGQRILDEIPVSLTEDLNLKMSSKFKDLYKNSIEAVEKRGANIGNIVDDIHKASLRVQSQTGRSVLPSRFQFAANMIKALDDLKGKASDIPDLNVQKFNNSIEKEKDTWVQWLTSKNATKSVTAKDMQTIKSELQDKAWKTKQLDDLPAHTEIARAKARAAREQLFEIAEAADPALATRLDHANLKYATALEINKKLAKKATEEANKSLDPFKGVFYGAVIGGATGDAGLGAATIAARRFFTSNLKNKLILLTNIEKANQKITNKISKSVKSFVDKTAKSRKAIPAVSTKILMQTQFSSPDEYGRKPKKPKDKLEAFKLISENLNKHSLNPQPLAEYLARNSLSTYDAAPNTSQHMMQTIMRAMDYLQSQIPKKANTTQGIFQRPYQPSDQEIAKFERILTAVNDPSSILDDLEAGTLTRDSVQAVKFVYPNFYSRVQQQILDEVAQTPDMPYTKRVQLGILFEAATDPSLVPQSIGVMQQTFKDVQQAQEAAKKETTAVSTTQGGLEKLNMANDAKSGTERITTRE